MTTPPPQRLVIVLTRNEHDDRASVAFTIANDALSAGMQVGMYLVSDGVELSRELGCEFAEDRDTLRPLLDLVTSFLESGGTLWYCASCFRHRGFKREEAFEKAISTDSRHLLEWIEAGSAILSF